MRRHLFVGLRPRLVILVLIALLPAIVLIVHGFIELRDREMTIARSEVIRLARLLASRKEHEIEVTHGLLMAVTRMPEVLSRPGSAIPPHDTLLESLHRQHSHHAVLAVADVEGRVLRSAVPSARPWVVGDKPWFRAVLASHRYTIGEYETWGPDNRPVLPLAFPACVREHSSKPSDPSSDLTEDPFGHPSGHVRFVAFAMLDTEWTAVENLGDALPEHYAISLLDRRGRILSRYPDGDGFQGASMANQPVVADLIKDPRERVEEADGPDGRRVWGFSPVHVDGQSVGFVGVGLPAGIAYAKARESLARNAVMMALMTFAVLPLAWYIGEKIVVPRLRSLVFAAESVAAGEHGVRTGISHESDEIGFLAEAFDRMASALDDRDAELRRTADDLRKSEAHYRQLFESMPLAAAVYDVQSLRFFMVNAMAEQVYGYSTAEFLDLRVTDLLPPDDVPAVTAWIAENFQEPLHSQVWNHRRKDGTIIQVEAVSHYLEANGRPARLALTSDVTERIRANQALMASRDQLRDLANQLQSAREAERARIARGIHDELGQALTGLKMDLSWLKGRAAQMDGTVEVEAIRSRIARMMQLTDDTVQTVRRIATELRPSVLDALGLVPALEWQSQDFQTRFGIKCHFRTRIEEMRLSPECATAVFRIFQETLTNVARHAHATLVTARLECVDNQISLTIRDNGIGIAPEALEPGRSLGLLGLRERAQVIGADIAITGQPGEGTEVVLTFPTGPRGCLLCGIPCTLRTAAGNRVACDVCVSEAPPRGEGDVDLVMKERP